MKFLLKKVGKVSELWSSYQFFQRGLINCMNVQNEKVNFNLNLKFDGPSKPRTK